MSTQYVWRVEHAVHGTGPWRGTGVWRTDRMLSCLLQHTRDASSYPCPATDSGIGDQFDAWQDRKGGSNVLCGCDSFQQLARWFGRREVVQALRDLGYHVARYNVRLSQVLRGTTQVVFDRRCAVSRSTLPVDYLLSGGER